MIHPAFFRCVHPLPLTMGSHNICWVLSDHGTIAFSSIFFNHLAGFLEFSKELSQIPESFHHHLLKILAFSAVFGRFLLDSWYALRPVPRPVALAGRLGHDAAGAARTGGAAWRGMARHGMETVVELVEPSEFSCSWNLFLTSLKYIWYFYILLISYNHADFRMLHLKRCQHGHDTDDRERWETKQAKDVPGRSSRAIISRRQRKNIQDI